MKWHFCKKLWKNRSWWSVSAGALVSHDLYTQSRYNIVGTALKNQQPMTAAALVRVHFFFFEINSSEVATAAANRKTFLCRLSASSLFCDRITTHGTWLEHGSRKMQFTSRDLSKVFVRTLCYLLLHQNDVYLFPIWNRILRDAELPPVWIDNANTLIRDTTRNT